MGCFSKKERRLFFYGGRMKLCTTEQTLEGFDLPGFVGPLNGCPAAEDDQPECNIDQGAVGKSKFYMGLTL